MLSLKFIQENPDLVVERLAVKQFDAREIVGQVLDLYRRRNETQNEVDSRKAEMNKLSKEIGMLFKSGKTEEANAAKARTAELKESIKEMGQEFDQIDDELMKLQVQLPNIPSPLVPAGKTDEDNLVVEEGGVKPDLGKNAKPHWELAEQYDLINFELGVKITGAGFPVYKGWGARLQRALINFFLDQARENGYIEVQPPYVVNEASGFGTGQLPDKEGQMYHATTDNLYLIPTAEVPVTNIFRDVIVDAKEFPIKYTAYSACFRREAGSYGKDVRGLNRLHQFDKVEVVQIAHPDKSYEVLDEMVGYVKSLVEKLELPFRILRLCGGDISFTSALTYDFEVWSAAQERWLEVSSVSNFESFQANRLKLRYREDGQKKLQMAHTLNGSALALPRIVAAILENYQTADGIRVPKVLVPYMGTEIIN
ncbi:serine--tRNA ligase [Prolixibacter sp. SD074]|jgi:seryl-tRNA synthetase|uniref:serine--tRNA ligase n=1 Tax=Prolixibacter sp. SD074 TaxID=2652391 RepID=UPI001275A9CC|nr:serine--tRNA ligase [Prolixibacter sp. SD074]GET30749.1 serine--tRNA ligase [Prolixibacter sp. SD074]